MASWPGTGHRDHQLPGLGLVHYPAAIHDSEHGTGLPVAAFVIRQLRPY